MMAVNIFSNLEILNKTLQGKYETVCGALKTTEMTIKNLEKHRNDDKFREIYVVLRKRCPPKRFTGNAENYSDDSAFECYKKQYFEMLDTSIVQLKERIYQAGMCNLMKIENMLLTGEVTADITERFSEFDSNKLKLQLQLFRNEYEYKNLKEAVDTIKSITIDVSIKNLNSIYSDTSARSR